MKKSFLFLMLAAMVAFVLACTPKEQPKPDSSKDATETPSQEPSANPSDEPSDEPSAEPSDEPSDEPSVEPTESEDPSSEPGEPSVEPEGISIDGDMSDWDDVPEAASSETGSYCLFKVISTDANIYLYSKRTTARMNELWGGAGYYYYAFDTDNNAETGDGTLWDNGPYEVIMALFVFGGSADAPEVINPSGDSAVKPSGTVANIVCKGVVTEDGVESELVIPRADLPAIPSGEDITIYTWGNKGANKLTATVKL